MGKQENIQPRKLKGFRDLLPHQARLKKTISDIIWKNAVLAGFEGIETPVLEFAETLLGTGEETDKEVYRFVDNGDRNVAMRFDLTVPFARYVVENFSELTFPFKKVQIGNVWRGEKPQKGRYREFCQADIDIIGVDSLSADVEVIHCILHNLNELLAQPFTMRLGHRIILSALIRATLPAVDPSLESKVLIILDKLAKIGRPAVRDLLAAMPGVDAGQPEQLLSRLEQKDAAGDTDLEALKGILSDRAEALLEIARLQETALIARRLSAQGKGRLAIDLSIARGLGYYTGIVFETTIDGLDGFGSIAAGGRYNGLVSRFSNTELAGIGGSIGVDRLLAAMEQMNEVKSGERRGVFIALAGSEARLYGFELLQDLRAQSIVADIALKEGKLGNQFKLADKRSFAWVLTIGGEELQSQTISLKNLATGSEHRGISKAQGFELLKQP